MTILELKIPVLNAKYGYTNIIQIKFERNVFLGFIRDVAYIVNPCFMKKN